MDRRVAQRKVSYIRDRHAIPKHIETFLTKQSQGFEIYEERRQVQLHYVWQALFLWSKDAAALISQPRNSPRVPVYGGRLIVSELDSRCC